MAPEQMLQENVGRKSDIWALGGVALLMATGQPPWAVCKVANPYACVSICSLALVVREASSLVLPRPVVMWHPNLRL